MEIIVPGGTRRSREGSGQTGYQLRLRQVRKSVGYLPPWRCVSFVKGTFYLCGPCFGALGDGPATNTEEMWTWGEPGGPVVPSDARCEKCGGRAWPAD